VCVCVCVLGLSLSVYRKPLFSVIVNGLNNWDG